MNTEIRTERLQSWARSLNWQLYITRLAAKLGRTDLAELSREESARVLARRES